MMLAGPAPRPGSNPDQSGSPAGRDSAVELEKADIRVRLTGRPESAARMGGAAVELET